MTRVHLVDGTFELFRCFHGAPRATGPDGKREVGAARAFLATMVALVADPAVTHVGVAFDSVVDPGRRGKGAEDLIASQAPLAAQVVRTLGLPVWPSGRYQADDMIAAACRTFAADPSVEQVVICSIDLDFTQLVRGERIVLLDRIRKRVTDEAAVRERFGVGPEQIPDLFGLIGDASDGLPPVPGWGPKSAAAVLARYGRLEDIPLDHTAWDVKVRNAEALAAGLRTRRDEALLCRDLSVLRADVPFRSALDDLRTDRPVDGRALTSILGPEAEEILARLP